MHRRLLFSTLLTAAAIGLAGCPDAQEGESMDAAEFDADRRAEHAAERSGSDDADSSAEPAAPRPTPSAQMAPAPREDAEGAPINAAGILFDVPASWKTVPPSSNMRLAEFELPGDAGAGNATIFCFGPGQGGSVDANIQRWVGQFTNPDDPNAAPEWDQQRLEQDGLKLVVVKAFGTYTPMSFGGPPAQPQPDQTLFGLIVEGGPQGTVFVRATGPAATMQQHAPTFSAFAKSAMLAE